MVMWVFGYGSYLGPASLEEIARTIFQADSPSGPKMEYLFKLEMALLQCGCKETHVKDLAAAVRKLLPCVDETNFQVTT